MNAKCVNWKKEEVGKVQLPKIFFSEEINLNLIHEVVRWQRACARQGTHKAKTRSDVSGGGKKPFKQKGTGNARQGSIRSPLNRSGGVTFGPKPRSYAYQLPLKIRKKALRQTLSYLFKENKITFVEDMKSTEGKAKELYQRLKTFGFKKALLVDHQLDPLFKRACKNLKFFQILPVAGLNVYDVLKFNQLVISKNGVSALEKMDPGKEE